MKNNIRELLIKNKITEKVLADRIGVSEGSISRYISGDREPKISIVIKMAQVFKCRIEDIYYMENQQEKTDNINRIVKLKDFKVPETCGKCNFIGCYEIGPFSRDPHCCCELVWRLKEEDYRVNKHTLDENCPLKLLNSNLIQ